MTVQINQLAFLHWAGRGCWLGGSGGLRHRRISGAGAAASRRLLRGGLALGHFVSLSLGGLILIRGSFILGLSATLGLFSLRAVLIFGGTATAGLFLLRLQIRQRALPRLLFSLRARVLLRGGGHVPFVGGAGGFRRFIPLAGDVGLLLHRLTRRRPAFSHKLVDLANVYHHIAGPRRSRATGLRSGRAFASQIRGGGCAGNIQLDLFPPGRGSAFHLPFTNLLLIL